MAQPPLHVRFACRGGGWQQSFARALDGGGGGDDDDSADDDPPAGQRRRRRLLVEDVSAWGYEGARAGRFHPFRTVGMVVLELRRSGDNVGGSDGGSDGGSVVCAAVEVSGCGFKHLTTKVSLCHHLNASGKAEWCAPESVAIPFFIPSQSIEPPPFGCPFVLKMDGSCGGHDVHFITDITQCRDIVHAEHQAYKALPFVDGKDFLSSSEDDANDETDNEAENEVDENIVPPSKPTGWVAQRIVSPPLLILGGRKFHGRVYCLGCKQGVFVYNRVEVRVARRRHAGASYADRTAHITNGTAAAERTLWDQVPELVDCFGTDHMVDFIRAVMDGEAAAAESWPDDVGAFRQFSVVAWDVMMNEGGQCRVLECNRGPWMPPLDDLGSTAFEKHVVKLVGEILRVVCPEIHCALRGESEKVDGEATTWRFVAVAGGD